MVSLFEDVIHNSVLQLFRILSDIMNILVIIFALMNDNLAKFLYNCNFRGKRKRAIMPLRILF